MITVFTPTYNRAYILPKLYDSLVSQTFHEFEWLVVDDGSTDNTEEYIRSIINENKINIRYIKKENGGKHTAHNIAVKAAKGDLFFICDSDDYLMSDEILQYVNDEYMGIIYRTPVAGFVGYMGIDNNHTLSDKRFPDEVECTSLYNLFYHTGIFDTVQIYKTDILRMHLFPEYKGEKFCPENLCWTSIDLDGYKVKVLRKVLEYAEYRDDGLTKNGGERTSVENNKMGFRDYSNVMYKIEKRFFKRWKWGGKYLALCNLTATIPEKMSFFSKICCFPFYVIFLKKYEN